MPVEQRPSRRIGVGVRDAKLVRYDEYIDTQIRTTRRMVKAVDVATVLLALASGVLGFLLAAAVAEHWLVPGGFGTLTRTVLFVVLAGGVGYYALRRLWPLVVRPINPVYAAQTIERTTPSLKNSLLNLLLFRQHRSEITDAVYETLEEQAAQRLTRVPVDSAVDRTNLVRLGYVLVAVVAICALYTMFSPKNPLVTAERVLMPWSDVVPASRVSISNVEPGATTLARGEVLEVSAEVRGIGDDDPVFVRYTSADGQAVDKSVQLAPSAAGLRYSGRIPAAEAGELAGVAQNLRYRIEAGDARSKEYAVTVVAAPTITVQRIDYDYPDYTGFVDRSVEALGDVRAIEGTRVTIHARANGPIEQAFVDFEADGRRDIEMNVDGTAARTSFVLTLRADRQTPRHTSYALRFTGTDGRANRDPVKFPIDVLPDYAPEVVVLAPPEKVRDVRLDETIAIEVEARDPDFALAEVRLHGEVTGRTVLDEPLLDDEYIGRFTGRFMFTPSGHDLRPGDVVRYWAIARDVRTEPNETSSEPRTFRIVSPDPDAQQPPPDRLAQRDRQPPPGGDGQQDQPQDAEPLPGDGDQNAESARGEPGDSGDTGEPASADERQQQSGRDSQPSADGSAPPQQRGDDQSAEGQQDQAAGRVPDEPGQQGDQAGDSQQQPGGSERANGRSDGQRNGAQGSDRSDERRPGSEAGDRSRNGQGDAAAERNERPSPVSPEGDNDGEAFDRIRRFLDRQGNSAKDSQRSADGDSPSVDEQQPAERDAHPGTDGEADQLSHDAQRNADRDHRDDSQSPRGQQAEGQGTPGAGEQPEHEQGAPDSQPGMKPADKWQQRPSNDQSQDDQEPPADGRGKRESDSQGDQGGDRAGGGEEGGGQPAEREGTGSAGQNQSADEGAGESSEQGAGHDSPNAGQDAPADDRTGQSGSDQQGEGSTQRDGQGDQAGGTAGDEDTAARSDGDQQTANHDAQWGKEGPPGSTPTGDGGNLPAGAGEPTATDATAPEGDAANLQYAREQTDLVLETLDEQLKRKQVDKQLLDELGWSADDLQRFIERWQQLRAASRGDDSKADAARRELDDALRSLGLRRGPLQQAEARQDEMRDLREGYRGPVPLEYQERLRAYNQGVSRARPNGE